MDSALLASSAASGADPRTQARIWLYRDGALYFWLLDLDGDGRGDCGAGTVAPLS